MESSKEKIIQAALDILEEFGLRMSYSPDTRAVYIRYQIWNECYPREVGLHTKELDQSIFVDLDSDEKILAVEILLPKEQ